MVIQQKLVTADEFEVFIDRPENSDRLFEFINGEIIEKMPGRTLISFYRELITVAVHIFCRQHNIPCYTSGEAGAYRILGNTVVPDFAYKHTPMSNEYPDPEPPEWAVEVISPTDIAENISAKRRIYIEAGILYWEMYPKFQTIDVYEPNEPMKTYRINDVLDGGDVMPGFSLPLKEIFKD